MSEEQVINKVLSPPVVVIVVTEYQPVQTHSYGLLSDLTDKLRELKAGPGPVQVFMVQGLRWHITNKPKPMLIAPDGEKFDLSNEDDNQIKPDLDGYLLPPPDDRIPSLSESDLGDPGDVGEEEEDEENE